MRASKGHLVDEWHLLNQLFVSTHIFLVTIYVNIDTASAHGLRDSGPFFTHNHNLLTAGLLAPPNFNLVASVTFVTFPLNNAPSLPNSAF
jgi:hypothetical protein